MIEMIKILPSVKKVIEEFPTNTKRTLNKKSYFHYVYSALCKSTSFLEIGYRKGLFLEVAKALDVPSVHIDISDELLRAVPTETNKAHTISSIDYLSRCSESFDFIFQDGSKEYNVRKKEYDLIMNNKILNKDGVIIADDLHYNESKEAFDYAIRSYGFKHDIFNVRDKNNYIIGSLY